MLRVGIAGFGRMGVTHAAILNQHQHVAPTAPSTHNPAVPAALDALVLHLLAKSPADRPQSAATVRERLSALL